jgi:hypothetical protein
MKTNNRGDYFSITSELESLAKSDKLSDTEKDILTIVVNDRKQFAWCELCFEMSRAKDGRCVECGCGIGFIDPYA